MRHLILILLFTTTVFAVQPTDDEVKKEMKSFQGKWQATFVQNVDGQEQTDVENQLTTMEVEENKFTMKTGSLTVKGTFAVDPSKKVKTIDVFFNDPNEPALRGIYETKGDTRKSCFAMPGKDRPTEFRKGKGFMVIEWRADK